MHKLSKQISHARSDQIINQTSKGSIFRETNQENKRLKKPKIPHWASKQANTQYIGQPTRILTNRTINIVTNRTIVNKA